MPTKIRRREDAVNAAIAPWGWHLRSMFGAQRGSEEDRCYEIREGDGRVLTADPWVDSLAEIEELVYNGELFAFGSDAASTTASDHQPGMICL